MGTWADEKLPWLALYLIPGLGNVAFKNLLEVFHSPTAILEADTSELTKIEGVRREVAQKIARKEFSVDPEKEITKIEKFNARVITYLDTSYPALLKEIHSPPMLLYLKGNPIPTDVPFVAVVGSRNPTHYGLKGAETIGFGLAKRGIGVVSGLAKGIDSAAHTGCLRGGGFTIAVMGTGIDVIYPPEGRELFNEITERGTILSEFPMGSPPEARNFPIRNRIISGLSKGVVVVEATKKSGSLITAAFALEQGRDVFAMPGSVDSFKSTGTHLLIKQGAKLIENVDDILDEFILETSQHNEGESVETRSSPLPEMDKNEKRVYGAIDEYPRHIDQIVRQTGMEARVVLSALMKMELKGIITQLPGKMFVR
jgi:DNA processing protein